MDFVRDKNWFGGEVTSRAYCVLAPNANPMTYLGTNTWVLHEPGCTTCIVVDPAPEGEQVQRVLAHCEEAGLSIGAIVATHSHFDHIMGIPELAAATGAPVYARDVELTAERMTQGWVEGGVMGCDPSAVPEILPLPDGEFKPFEGAPAIQVLSTPGHSQDSISMLLTDETSLLTGDILFKHGTTVINYPEGDLRQYMATLDLLEGMIQDGSVVRFLPGHGYAMDDPLVWVRLVRQHRLDRLDQIKGILDNGTPADPEAIFVQAYPEIIPRLKVAAIRSIQAQLAYLGIEQ